MKLLAESELQSASSVNLKQTLEFLGLFGAISISSNCRSVVAAALVVSFPAACGGGGGKNLEQEVK